MKKRKGFTLIELLAVIVILAIVMIIAIPQILKVIEKTEMESFRESVELMIHTAKIQYNADEVQGIARKIPEEGFVYEYDVDGKETIQTQDSINQYGYLNFKGDKPRSGTLTMTKNKKFIVNKLTSKMHNGKYCAVKNLDEEKVRVGKSKDMGCEAGSDSDDDEIVEDKKPCELEVDSHDSSILYIDSASDLYQFSIDVNAGTSYSGKTIRVRNNLDMSTAQGTCVGTFEPIGTESHKFAGTFDGYEKTIKNLTINKSGSDYVGLFGYLSGKIKGLIVENITVTGRNYVGALVGNSRYSGAQIKDVIVKDSKVTGNSYVSSIGYGEGSISSVIVRGGSVTMNDSNGKCSMSALQYDNPINYALVENLNVNSNNCVREGYGTKYSNGVKLNGTNVTSGFPITDIGDINFYDAIGIDTWIGSDNDNSGYYFDYNKKGEITVKSVEKSPFTFTLTGSGTEASPYIINNEKQWKEVSARSSYNSVYLLANNLDFSNNKFYMLGSSYNSGANRFKGTLKGGAKTIKNVTINASNADNIGIIGLGEKVVGLTVENVKVSGNNYVGALGSVSDVLEVIIKNVDVSGGASVSSNGNMFDLGIVGNVVVKGGKLTLRNSGGTCYSAHSYYSSSQRITPYSIINDLQMPASCSYSRDNSYISSSSTIGGTSISSGFSSADMNDINFYEAAGLDTWIGGDNNSSGYYFDYNDAGTDIIIKSVSENPINSDLSGSGTEDDPYLIASANDWKKASAKSAANKNFKITSNIDFSGKKFYMLGSFSNSFTNTIDGGAKYIKNVTINASKTNYIGLLGYGSGNVYGLNLENITVRGNNYVGALSGRLSHNAYSRTREISLSNINISGNDYVGSLNGQGTGVYSNNSGYVNNILVKSGSVSSNTANCYAAGIISPYSSSSIIENLSLSPSSCSYQNTSTGVYASNNVKVGGTNISDGFPSGEVGDLLYYSGKLETVYEGDANNTGYLFDYVSSKGGVYVVEKHDLAFNPTGDPGTGESGGSCSCSAWTQKSNTVYRTNSDATCTGSQYSTNSSGCYTYKIVGTGEISNTASGHWFCKAKIYTRTCTK